MYRGYICKTKCDFIECQKYLFEKGYRWIGDGDQKIISDYVDEVIIYANINRHFGKFMKYSQTKYKIYVDKFIFFGARKKKLKRIIN